MIELTYDILDPEKATSAVRRDTNGSVVTFLGTTRDNFEGKSVITLEYEALHMDRDWFDEELQYFAHEHRIPLDYEAFVYGENDMEVLTISIPYEEERT